MFAQVHDGVGLETVGETGAQPAVRRQVVVTGRQVRIVVDRHRVVAEPTRRLDHHHHIAGLHCRDHDFTVGVAAAIDEQLPGGGPNAPVLPRRNQRAR